ncbi:hypothetical protein EAG_16016, partial [Camponotus floridanus]
KISNLRYADNTTLLGDTEEEIIRLMFKVDEVNRDEDLKINTSKTKIMIVDRPTEEELVPVSIGGIEIVKEFIYLGAKLTNTGSCETEIRTR